MPFTGASGRLGHDYRLAVQGYSAPDAGIGIWPGRLSSFRRLPGAKQAGLSRNQLQAHKGQMPFLNLWIAQRVRLPQIITTLDLRKPRSC